MTSLSFLSSLVKTRGGMLNPSCSPDVLSPRTLSPCAVSPNGLRNILKNQGEHVEFSTRVYQKQCFYHHSSRRPDLLRNISPESTFSLSPSGLRVQGLRAQGLRA